MLNILYEDNHVIVVEKPVNIPSQGDKTGDEDMISIIKKYLVQKYNKPGEAYVGLVHRLDRPVGGVMVFAKTSKAASRLSMQIKNQTFKKTYIAVVKGNIKKEDTFVDKLLKDNKTNTVKVSEQGKTAILSYHKLAFKDNLSLVQIDLKTGRPHQIRVQFASRGYPLIGEQKYAANMPKIPLALFAKKIEFYHPVTKEKLVFELSIPDKYPFILFKK